MESIGQDYIMVHTEVYRGVKEGGDKGREEDWISGDLSNKYNTRYDFVPAPNYKPYNRRWDLMYPMWVYYLPLCDHYDKGGK
jgi:hypothetical protein